MGLDAAGQRLAAESIAVRLRTEYVAVSTEGATTMCARNVASGSASQPADHRHKSLPRPAERIDLTYARPAHDGRLPVRRQAHEGIKRLRIVHALQSA
jgi:hypothetical protein